MSSVLVILEQRSGAWNRMSWETLAAAHELAGSTGLPVLGAVPARLPDELAAQIKSRNLSKVYAIEHDLLVRYTADGFTAALEQLIRKVQPAYVLFPHTYQVRDFAPKLATRFGETLIADVVSIRTESGVPAFVRQLLQGKLNADYVHRGDSPCFVSVQAGAFRAAASEESALDIERFIPELTPSMIRSAPGEPFQEVAHTIDLNSANAIVAAGRGIKDQENLRLVEELAAALGAEIAGSRPICDNGWLPMERQIGSSGQTVAPNLYVAVGISGAIQHLVGMKGSKTIVAINKDENAPIFEIADYGIVGDLFEVLPALTAAIRKAKTL